MSDTPRIGVYQAINAVQAELAETGITKNRKNQQQGYSFRGIDDVFNALSPLLAKHKLCILPRVVEKEAIERQSAQGKPIFYTLLTVDFDFVSAVDGSIHTVRTVGEAMDSADKSSNKAMSAAYKYAAFQAFAIPTEGENDADAVTHEVAPRPQVSHPQQRANGGGITDRQLDMIRHKRKTLGWDAERVAQYASDLGIHNIEKASTKDASRLIEALQRELDGRPQGGE
jgi:hypothetical protein